MANLPVNLVLPDGWQNITPWDLTSIAANAGYMIYPIDTLYPTANLAIFVPIRVSRFIKLALAFWYNGSAVAGNVDIGIYSADGRKLGNTGSVAQAGTSVIQTNALTTEFGPGLFYLAFISSSGSARFLVGTMVNAQFCRVLGMAQMATAIPLPATATFAAVANAYIPMFGVTPRSFV